MTTNARNAIAINNDTRQAFVDALMRQFNSDTLLDLPPAVQRALVGTHAKTATGDFGFDPQGNVASVAVDACGVLPDYWIVRRPLKLGDGTTFTTPGAAGRERLVENIFNEMVRAFNTAHPELALR